MHCGPSFPAYILSATDQYYQRAYKVTYQLARVHWPSFCFGGGFVFDSRVRIMNETKPLCSAVTRISDTA